MIISAIKKNPYLSAEETAKVKRAGHHNQAKTHGTYHGTEINANCICLNLVKSMA